MGIQDQELIRNEIEILKLCQHPNIIKLFDVLENSENIFIVMELLQGGDLLNYLEQKKFKLPEMDAAIIFCSIAKALIYLHDLGIVHRDIKPENILMVKDTNIKIVDFGLSTFLGTNDKCKGYAGTLTFAAPEVIMEFPYDKNADWWSLGIILYSMLSGRMPFPEADSREAKRMWIMQGKCDTNSKGWENVTNEAKDLVNSTNYLLINRNTC